MCLCVCVCGGGGGGGGGEVGEVTESAQDLSLRPARLVNLEKVMLT